MSHFKASANALAALYKTASAEIDAAYSDGAREALELLLSSMDRENLGLQEGEGWRVRQMVMELWQGLGKQQKEVPPIKEEEKDTKEDVERVETPAQVSPPAPASKKTAPSQTPLINVDSTSIPHFSAPTTEFSFMMAPPEPFQAMPMDISERPARRNTASSPTKSRTKLSAPLGPSIGTKRKPSPGDSDDKNGPREGKRSRYGDHAA